MDRSRHEANEATVRLVVDVPVAYDEAAGRALTEPLTVYYRVNWRTPAYERRIDELVKREQAGELVVGTAQRAALAAAVAGWDLVAAAGGPPVPLTEEGLEEAGVSGDFCDLILAAIAADRGPKPTASS